MELKWWRLKHLVSLCALSFCNSVLWPPANAITSSAESALMVVASVSLLGLILSRDSTLLVYLYRLIQHFSHPEGK
ncbi:hypothetical protein HAX54_029334 [Datura stramonium]|uniref:Uncharacterized protein n=1 Tax=Datura stramonium TaxID=4076 RepID=A0ABS8V923_DATST|nr:hypothetical protein [Datura stramonium]